MGRLVLWLHLVAGVAFTAVAIIKAIDGNWDAAIGWFTAATWVGVATVYERTADLNEHTAETYRKLRKASND